MRMPILGPLVLGLIGGAAAALIVTGLDSHGGSTAGPGPRQDSARIDATQTELVKMRNKIGELELRIEAIEAATPERTLSGAVLPAVPDPLGPAAAKPPTGEKDATAPAGNSAR